MKFLIAGFGSIGRRHMRNLLALGEKDIVLYRSHRSTLPQDELEGFPVETSLEAALAHQPDALIVSNPTRLHLDVAIPAAEQGCHILMEKPLSNDLSRVGELKKALEVSGGKLLMGFQFRYHPGLRQVENLLKSGAIGRPLSLRSHWGEYLPGWHPWEDYRKSYSARKDLGGGVVLTLCHSMDYLRWLFGDVNWLSAFTGQISDLEIEVEDTAEISMRFSGGVIGSVHLDYCQRPPVHWMEIVGTEGTMRWDNADGGLEVFNAAGDEWKKYPVPEGFDRNDLFLAEMRHFIEIIRGEAEPLCTLDDGVRIMEMIQAVYDSSDQHRQLQF